MASKISKILTALFIPLYFLNIPTSAIAENKKTVPDVCQRLFTETDKLLKEAERQPGTHTQVSKIKTKLEQSKQQILAMDNELQTKSCEQGLAKLARLKPQEENQ